MDAIRKEIMLKDKKSDSDVNVKLNLNTDSIGSGQKIIESLLAILEGKKVETTSMGLAYKYASSIYDSLSFANSFGNLKLSNMDFIAKYKKTEAGELNIFIRERLIASQVKIISDDEEFDNNISDEFENSIFLRLLKIKKLSSKNSK